MTFGGPRGPTTIPISWTAADRAFQRAMCPAVAGSGQFVLYRLCVDGVAIAFRSTFLMGDRAFAYRTSFDPAFAKFGPARLLLHHVFLELSKSGVRAIELMRGDSQQKRELTDTKLILYSGVRRGSGRLGLIAAPTLAGANAARVLAEGVRDGTSRPSPSRGGKAPGSTLRIPAREAPGVGAPRAR